MDLRGGVVVLLTEKKQQISMSSQILEDEINRLDGEVSILSWSLFNEVRHNATVSALVQVAKDEKVSACEQKRATLNVQRGILSWIDATLAPSP